MENPAFKLEMKVRDYECDFQGVVHNSNYQRYMEHARHEFLETHGCTMSALHDAGIDPMVAKTTIEYKWPLRGSDRFVVHIDMKREGAKIVFLQEIYNIETGRLIAKGRIDVVCLENGHLTRGEKFDEVFKDFFNRK